MKWRICTKNRESSINLISLQKRSNNKSSLNPVPLCLYLWFCVLYLMFAQYRCIPLQYICLFAWHFSVCGLFSERNDQHFPQPINIAGAFHRLIRVLGRNRTCAYCGLTGNKTSSGFARKSYYRCDVCDVSLCAKYNCFDLYHELVRRHGGRPVTWKAYYDKMKKRDTQQGFLPGSEDVPFIVTKFNWKHRKTNL